MYKKCFFKPKLKIIILIYINRIKKKASTNIINIKKLKIKN